MLSLLLLLLFFFTAQARADDQIRAVRLSNVVGSVQILSGTETVFSQAYPNMPLVQGTTLKTGEDGRAEIQLEDGSVVRLTPNTSVALSVLGRSSQGNLNTEVDLLTGLSYVGMSGTANQRFVVHFGDNEVISPAPAKFRVNLDANPVEIAMLDGSAHLSNGAVYSVDVKANETVRFDGTDSTRYFLAQGIDGDSWDQWNSDRDQAMSQMAARETREARGNANPNDPGWSDLDYNGNWYAAPGGGSFWAPNGAGPGWDPYGSGYWGYYGGLGGYTWISGYSWGWLPFHCGAWNYFNSFGWGWTPGGCGGWLPVSGFGGYFPPNYRPIPRPVPRHGGPVHNPINRLIAVDRGPAATTLTPHAGAVPRPIAINGQVAHPLPKTSNPAVAGSLNPRPVAVATPGRTAFANGGGSQLGSVPVYRPVAPASGVRAQPVYSPGPSSFAPRANGGPVAAPHYSAPSAPHYSAPSAPAMSSAPHATSAGGGGGHVR